MSTKKVKAKPYELDCSHVIWLIVPPDGNYPLWCVRCQKDEPLKSSTMHKHGRIFDPTGECWTEKTPKGYKGGCLYTDCDYHTAIHGASTGYETLSKRLHKHYMKAHTRFGTVEIKVGAKLPPNSLPDF